MSGSRNARIKLAVESKYSSIALGGAVNKCCGMVDSSVPQSAKDVALSCGSPLSHVELKEGMTVLDLGSGGGIDAFAAAAKLGSKGKVIGIDSTAKMVARARRTAKENDYVNVEFRLGEMERLPVRSGTADLIVSNCAVNLVPNKERAFGEMYRALKPGGRLAISDIVAEAALPSRVKGDVKEWSSCLAGALTFRGLKRILTKVGFVGFCILEERAWEKGREKGLALSSITFSATKPKD